MATTSREFSLILHGEEIYEESTHHEITNFVGVSILINLEQVCDSQMEEGHGVHDVSFVETEIVSAYLYVVDDNLDTILVQKLDNPSNLLDYIINYI